VASPALERAARQALLDIALSGSPRAEEVTPLPGAHASEASVFLDASGVGSLFGSEQGLATALVTRSQALGLPAVAAIASSRTTARLIARRLARDSEPGSTHVVPAQQEISLLAPLPVDLLDPDDALADTLTRFGIRCLGQLLSLPRRALVTRLGSQAWRWVARLRGEESEPPLSAPRDQKLIEEMDLEVPVDRLEPLSFVLRGMLTRLLERLALRSLACPDLELSLDLVGGGRESRHLGLAAPTLDARVLLRRLRLALEASPPRAEVEAVTLATRGSPARTDQLDLFRPAGPAPAALDTLLAELEALCGSGCVGAPQRPDTHRLDAFGMRPFVQAKRAARPTVENPSTAPLAVRALRPPVPAQVRLQAGRPAQIRSALANGDVMRCSGPWRTTGAWWCLEDAFAFDYFDAMTSDGLLVRLRFDRLHHTWELDAVYD
jgi:protein ImuB